MIYEFVGNDERVYGTMPLYTNGKPNSPYGRMLDLMRKHRLISMHFRIGRVDLR